MFCKNRFDLAFCCKTTLARSFDPSIDSFEFFRCRVIQSTTKPRTDLECYCCKFSLHLFRPRLYALHHVFEYL